MAPWNGNSQVSMTVFGGLGTAETAQRKEINILLDGYPVTRNLCQTDRNTEGADKRTEPTN